MRDGGGFLGRLLARVGVGARVRVRVRVTAQAHRALGLNGLAPVGGLCLGLGLGLGLG